ncbi:MAG TPA: PDZ domain-containing protein [Planktothrix sp.]|jgi:hypothetical protein
MLKKCGLLSVLPVVALMLQLPIAALADSSTGLQMETPEQDTPIVGTTNVAQDSPSFLRGEVSRRDQTEGRGDDNSQSQSAGASQNDATLNSEKPAPDANIPYELAAEKLQKGFRLSAQEYRDLGVGCFGFESYRPLNRQNSKITDVYAGSPAAEAGIRKGDVVLKEADDAFKDLQSTTDVWTIELDKAGTAADVTLLRHGQPVTLTLTRMNVEDIASDRVRHEWERIIRSLGSPEKGAFIIPKP